MPRAPKRCGSHPCPAYATPGKTYCATHQAERMRRAAPSPSSRAGDDPAERERRAAAVSAWVNDNGWVCPGYRRDPHVSHDLTAAHATAVAAGGTRSPLTVLCRGCNSRQGTTPTQGL